MEQKKCPICQRETDRDSSQCPYCKYRFPPEPPKASKAFTEKNERLDGYLISDIEDCLVKVTPETIAHLIKAAEKPVFNTHAEFGGNLWFAHWGLLDISISTLAVNVFLVPMMSAAYGWIHKGDRFLTNKTGYVFLFIGILWLLEAIPLGNHGDRLLWNRTKTILDSHNCKDQDPKEDLELKKKLGESGAPSVFSFRLILAMDGLFVYFCYKATAALFTYFGYLR